MARGKKGTGKGRKKSSGRKRSTKRSSKSNGKLIATTYSNRRTPRVHQAGTKPKKPKANWGKRTGSYTLSKKQAAQARSGKWVKGSKKMSRKRGIGPKPKGFKK